MTENDTPDTVKTEPAGLMATTINIFTSPSEAFTELLQRPTKLFPLVLIMASQVVVLFWYFTIVDFDWFIDDTLLTTRDLTEAQMEAGREQLQSMSQSTFRIFGVLGGSVGVLIIFVLQAGYLSLVSALIGDKFKFTNWFSLITWTGLPFLLAVIGQVVNLLLSPNGQLSAIDLNPLTLANLGMEAEGSLRTIMQSIDLTIIWSLSLVVVGYKQWLDSSWTKALSVVLAPYVLILSIWAYFTFT